MAVKFNEPEALERTTDRKRVSALSKLVLQTGLVKTEMGAQRVLISLAFLVFLIAVFLFIRMQQTPPPLPDELFAL
ncbi:MAG: hypothetical protein WBK28_03255 [Minisyncoccia bacterium]